MNSNMRHIFGLGTAKVGAASGRILSEVVLASSLFTALSAFPVSAQDPASSAGTVSQQAQQILEAFDKDKDGKLSRDEYAHGTVKMYEALDLDQDNSLNKKELKRHGDKELSKADANSDSNLSFTEVLKYQENAFDGKDLNHDGYLSRDEIEACIQKKVDEGKLEDAKQK